MSDLEVIANQERLLSEHRRRLAVLLHQHARLGIHAPPHIRLEIEDVQGLIYTYKAQLRAWNVAVEDRPEDTAAVGHSSSGDSLAQAQALLATLPLDTIPDAAVLPVGSRMPLSRNSSFVGRIADLKHLAVALKGGGTAAIGQTAAVTGLGGIGKTNLATEFVHRYGQYFAGGVFWLSFADPAAVPAEVAACGVGLDLPGFAALTLSDRAARVMQVWQQPLPRLLIFDNCEDEALLTEWRPTSGGCRVLVTSRRARWSTVSNVQSLGLGVLAREESIALLCRHRPDVAGHDPDLDTIAAELGDLPLALHLAGSYLEAYRDDPDFGDPAAFLAELRDARLIEHPALYGEDVTPSPTNHALHIGRTFALSYEQLRPDDPTDALAIKLLARTTCFAPGVPIPRDLLFATAALPDKAAQRRGSKALSRLVDLGLLETEQDGMLKLHRLLAHFVGSIVADDTAQRAVEEAVGAIAADLNRKVNLPGLVAIQVHLRHIATVAMPREEPHVAWLCNEFAFLLYLVGDFPGVHPYVERALAIREHMLGPEHPDTAEILNNLGQLFRAEGQYAAARPFYERALAIQERVLGPEHPDTARTLNNLGALVWEQGDLQGALPYVERALAIREQVLGSEHPDTAMSLNHLASLLQVQGQYTAAHPLYERALAIREHVLGPEHSGTSTSLNNLGGLLVAQGLYIAARPYLERALAIREHLLGPEHPGTADSLNNLAQLFEAQEQYAAARPLYERALGIREHLLGPEHPDTAESLNNLGKLLQAQGDLAGARLYLERALAIREHVLGPTHPATGLSLTNLGALLWAQGDSPGARSTFERALAIQEDTLGAQHPDMACSIWWVGTLLRHAGDIAGARMQYQRAIAIYTDTLGAEHPTTRQCQHTLAALD